MACARIQSVAMSGHDLSLARIAISEHLLRPAANAHAGSTPAPCGQGRG